MSEIIIGKKPASGNGKPKLLQRLAADTRITAHGERDISDETREAIEEIARLRDAIRVFQMYDMTGATAHPAEALAMIPMPWGALRRLAELASREP